MRSKELAKSGIHSSQTVENRYEEDNATLGYSERGIEDYAEHFSEQRATAFFVSVGKYI